MLPNRFVKNGEEPASDAQIKYVYEAFEKKSPRYELTGNEAQRRLNLYNAQCRLEKPTGCRPAQCPFRKGKDSQEEFTLGAGSSALTDW